VGRDVWLNLWNLWIFSSGLSALVIFFVWCNWIIDRGRRQHGIYRVFWFPLAIDWFFGDVLGGGINAWRRHTPWKPLGDMGHRSKQMLVFAFGILFVDGILFLALGWQTPQ
jgi:hypothetical protein